LLHELSENWITRREHSLRNLCNWASRPTDYERPGYCRDAYDSNGRKLDRSHRCRHSLYLVVATLIKIRDMKGIPTSFARHADSSRRSKSKTEALAGTGHFPGQSAGISTQDRSNSAIDAQPSSLRVRTKSLRRISMARATPAPPAAPSPYA
jgi:hypothetical protein